MYRILPHSASSNKRYNSTALNVLHIKYGVLAIRAAWFCICEVNGKQVFTLFLSEEFTSTMFAGLFVCCCHGCLYFVKKLTSNLKIFLEKI